MPPHMEMAIEKLTILPCGDSIIEVVDIGEEHLTISNSSTGDSAFDAVIGSIEDIMENEFLQLHQSFMEKHYLEFDDSEENKLSYTPIFNEYVNLLEKHLEQQLMERIPGFNMNALLGPGHHKDEVDKGIFDILLSFTDFMAFKEMIVYYRTDRDLDLSQALVVTSLKLF